MKSAQCILLHASAVPALRTVDDNRVENMRAAAKLSSAMSATRFSLKDTGTKQQGPSDVLAGPAVFDVTLHSSVLFLPLFKAVARFLPRSTRVSVNVRNDGAMAALMSALAEAGDCNRGFSRSVDI